MQVGIPQIESQCDQFLADALMPVCVWIVCDVLLFAVFITSDVVAILIFAILVNEVPQIVTHQHGRFGEGTGVDVLRNLTADDGIHHLAVFVDVVGHDGEERIVHDSTIWVFLECQT
jgi:hypothetical protein